MQLKTNNLKFLTREIYLALGLMLFTANNSVGQEIIEDKKEEKVVEEKVEQGKRMKLDGVAAVTGTQDYETIAIVSAATVLSGTFLWVFYYIFCKRNRKSLRLKYEQVKASDEEEELESGDLDDDGEEERGNATD